MCKHIVFFMCFGIIAAAAKAQSEYSAEYMHGFAKNFNEDIIGGRYEGFSGRNSWGLGINYNLSSWYADKKKSKGRGWGIYADYRYALDFGLTGNPFAGIRTTFIFCKSNNGENYSVWTPSLHFGYHYTSQDFNKGGAFTPSIALGYDVKLNDLDKAKGIHDGAVFLAGITAGYRF